MMNQCTTTGIFVIGNSCKGYGKNCASTRCRIRSKYVWIVSEIPLTFVRFHACTSCPAKIAHILYISNFIAFIFISGVYCPIGWDTTHYLKPQFFTKTLPEIATLLSLDTINLDPKNRRLTRKRKRDENTIPSGVIFLPFTLGVVTELFKALDVITESYTISYLDREQLMVEHPMYAATASIPDDEMKLLNKKPRPEDGYANDLFKNIDVGASSNVNVRNFKGYVQSNCTEQIRMIKLILRKKMV